MMAKRDPLATFIAMSSLYNELSTFVGLHGVMVRLQGEIRPHGIIQRWPPRDDCVDC